MIEALIPNSIASEDSREFHHVSVVEKGWHIGGRMDHDVNSKIHSKRGRITTNKPGGGSIKTHLSADEVSIQSITQT